MEREKIIGKKHWVFSLVVLVVVIIAVLIIVDMFSIGTIY